MNQEPGARSQEPESRSQEPGARSQEPESRSQNPGARIQEPESRSQNPGARIQEPEGDKKVKKLLILLNASGQPLVFLGHRESAVNPSCHAEAEGR